MHEQIHINSFTPGMELALPIKNKFGQVMLPAGTILEEKHRKFFNLWGITEFTIMKSADDFQEEESKDFSEYLSFYGNRLRWKPSNDFETDLLDMGIQYLQK